MADQLMPSAIDAAFKKLIDLTADDIRIQLVGSGYTFSTAHDFMDDVGANKVGTAIALAGKTFSGGVFNATSPISYGATVAIAAGAYLYVHTGADGTARLIFWIDGKTPVVIAAAASSGATSLTVEVLEGAIPSGTSFTIGGVSVTTTALAAEGARTISVAATSGAIAIGSTSEASKGAGFPLAAAGAGVNIAINQGASKIFQVVP